MLRTPLGRRFGTNAVVWALTAGLIWLWWRDEALRLVIVWGVASLLFLVLMVLAEKGRIGQRSGVPAGNVTQRRAIYAICLFFALLLAALLLWLHFRPASI